MKRMAGPAATVSTMVTSSRAATGAISTSRTLGTSPSSGAQKERMPARLMAIKVAKPEKIRNEDNHQAEDRSVVPSASGSNMAVNIANFARKAESGGSPARSSVQMAKLMPSTTSVSGMAMPTSSSRGTSSNSLSPSP